MKKWILISAIFALIAAGVYWQHPHSLNSQDREVKIEPVERGPIDKTIESTGNVAPLNRVEIKPAISGRIDSYLVDEGSSVKAGQVIAWMSSSDRVAIMDAARAQGPEAFKRWENSYKPTPIIAPISGTIILRNIVNGQTVDASTVLFAMSDRLIIVAQVDETDIGLIRRGMEAKIILDAYPRRVTMGRVFDILHEGVNTSNVITYNVKISPDGGAPYFFKSQMTANVSFIVKEDKDALLVPLAAVTQKGGHARVFVVSENGKSATQHKKPIAREVTVGISDENHEEILSGLKVGDLVVILRKKYSPQHAQTSPLAFGGKKKK